MLFFFLFIYLFKFSHSLLTIHSTQTFGGRIKQNSVIIIFFFFLFSSLFLTRSIYNTSFYFLFFVWTLVLLLSFVRTCVIISPSYSVRFRPHNIHDSFCALCVRIISIIINIYFPSLLNKQFLEWITKNKLKLKQKKWIALKND